MDKMNVISITSDLDALNKDMQDWSFLPMELKMRSNDECIRQYGMTVPSLYNKLKLDILKSGEQDIPSNIKPLGNDSQVELEGVFDELSANGADNVPVDFNFGDIEKSRQLQQNPLIVIIDPTDSEEEVASKIQSYNALTEKFKRLSDSYSFEFYGFNVRNMYKMVLSGIWTSDAEEEEEGSNLIIGESTKLTEPLSEVENSESVFNACMDIYREVYMNHDGIGECKVWTSLIKDPTFKNKTLQEEGVDFLFSAKKLSTPTTALPWYTVKDQLAMGITPNIDPNRNYLDQVKEAMAEYKANPCDETANRVLELGWNYEVDINPGSIKAAKEHYISVMEHTCLYDVRSLNEYDIIDRKEDDPIPIYFIFTDNGIRLSLDSDLLRSISPVGSVPADNTGYGEVYVTFVDSLDGFDFEKFKSYKTLEIYDSTIKFDHDIEKVNKFIDIIIQVSNRYKITWYKVYLVYKGNLEDYDYMRTDQIVDALLHHKDEICRDNNIDESCYRLTPSKI